MKKAIVFLLFLLISNLLFAVELWNGFTSDMTVETAIARAREVLNLSAEPRVNNDDAYLFLSVSKSDYPIPFNFPQMVWLRSRYGWFE